MCKVSVIIPMYNVEKTIGRCIESVLNQTFKDIEILIINDGTPDHSREIAEKYTTDSRVQIIDKENAGLPQARRTGVENAKGEYLFFLDSDDWIEANTLEILYREIMENNADIACCNVQVDYSGKTHVEYIMSKETGIVTKYETIQLLHSMRGVFQYVWNKLYRREIVNLDDFPEGNFIGEDYCTVLSVLDKADVIVQVSEILYHYVQNDGGMTKKGFGETYTLAYKWNTKIREELLVKYPVFEREIMSYHMLQDMAVLNAMFRNDVYDNELKQKIIRDVRRNLVMYLTCKDVRLLHKICAVFIAFNWRIYKMIYKKLFLMKE